MEISTNVTMVPGEIWTMNKGQALVIFSKLDIGLVLEPPITWDQL